MARGEWHNFRCPTCRHGYEGRALLRLAEISKEQVSEKFGEDSSQVAHSLCYLAQAHAQLGNALTSMDLLKQGLVIQENKYGHGHVATAAMLAELASAYGKLGDVKKQRELLEKSLEIKERHFGVGHINTAVTLNNLATAHSELGNVYQEKELLERSLQIKERHYGKGHVQTTAALVNLAGVYGELGDVPKAREFLEWSLEIEERHFGKGHVETAITLNNLALACGEEGDLSRMLELLSRSLAIKEQHFGTQHPELCLTLANLGMVCGALGNESTATGHCRQALHICGLPGSPRNSRRHGVVLLRAASVEVATGEEAADIDHNHSTEAASGGLLGRSVKTLQDALGPTASSRVLALERIRMERIWTAAGRADVVQRIQRLLEPVTSEPLWTKGP
jgi:tetratricopeptide (TPR) repeat protein